MTPARSADFYQRVLDHLGLAVAAVDAGFRLTYLNLAGEMLFGTTTRQVFGVRVGDFFSGLDHDIERELARSIETGAGFTKRGVSLQLPKQTVPVNLSILPLLDPAAGGGAVIQLEQVDSQLRSSLKAQFWSQQNAARSLLRALAHEIKNPLGGLRGAAQLLDRELADDELREYTRIIIEEADRLKTLVDRMLVPNKPPRKARLNVHQVLERVRQLVQVEAPAGICIERDYDPSIPVFIGDRDQLIQAILNIVRNAAQAVGDHGLIRLRTRVARQVTIGPKLHRLAVKIDVIDDGPGIPEELLGQIFYPMVSGCPAGIGLGLSITQSLIHQHGGTIECTSRPGATVFSILLPLEDSHAS